MHLQEFHLQPAGCKLRQHAIRRNSAAAGCQQHATPQAGGEFRQLLQYAAPEDDARGSCKLEQRLGCIGFHQAMQMLVNMWRSGYCCSCWRAASASTSWAGPPIAPRTTVTPGSVLLIACTTASACGALVMNTAVGPVSVLQ